MAAKTFYCGNLAWSVTDQDLKDFFSSYGSVTSAQVVMDKETGRSRGFGFVTMENADKAMIDGNGKELKGRGLKISEARQRR